MNLIQAGRELHAAVDACDTAVAEALGIHRSDLRCLNLLEHGPMSPSDIGRQLKLSSGAVTALIDRLERLDFVQRVRSATDRRSLSVEIPPENHARTARLYRQVAFLMMQRFAGLPADELEKAADALRRFAAACNEGAAQIARSTETDV